MAASKNFTITTQKHLILTCVCYILLTHVIFFAFLFAKFCHNSIYVPHKMFETCLKTSCESCRSTNSSLKISWFTRVFRSSHQRCSLIEGVFRNFKKLTGKQLYQNLFFNKVTVLRPATLLKRRLWHKCFPGNFSKFLRTHFPQNTSK